MYLRNADSMGVGVGVDCLVMSKNTTTSDNVQTVALQTQLIVWLPVWTYHYLINQEWHTTSCISYQRNCYNQEVFHRG